MSAAPMNTTWPWAPNELKRLVSSYRPWGFQPTGFRRSATARRFPSARTKVNLVGSRTVARVLSLFRAARLRSWIRAVNLRIPSHKLSACLTLASAVWLSSCVNPQQVELLEREQRRLRTDMGTLHTDVD